MTDVGERTKPRQAGLSVTATQVAGLASLGAGAIHAAAIGIHAEHATLSRLFVVVAAAQLAVGLITLVRGGRSMLALNVLVNGGAVAAWVVTRTSGVAWIEGLETTESPQFADTACAALGALAAGAALLAILRGTTRTSGVRLGVPAVALGALTVAAMMYGGTHVHSESHGEAESAAGEDNTHGADAGAVAAAAGTEEVAHPHPAEPAGVEEAAATDDHHAAATEEPATEEPATEDHHVAAGEAAATEDHGHAEEAAITETAAVWPRAWDPASPVDFSGVDGVTPEQQARAEALVSATLRDLPQFADVTTLPALGYRSIGDGGTGFEHFVNYGFIADDAFLDPTKPESLVYQVDGDARTLVSAMFIAKQTPLDDPVLVDYGGQLMQWHNHPNLCWAGTDDGPKVVGVLDPAGNCPAGSVNAGGDNPMVHVWIAPHECGPFAALEGHGAGQADPATGTRVDQCGHGDHDAQTDDAATVAFDPTKPIDLSGVEGVTLEQQAFAENLVAVTVVQLPQWADPAVAEAAGFRSIGDAATGHEHYIQWDWINDDVWLDPDFPESLVYAPQPDGGKQLVSAMYMLPDTVTLDQVPDYGGRLMQWHIHDNLCFTDDPEAPLVRGLRDSGGTCAPPLVARAESPMIHVWITPTPCGPFAALEGVGAGAVKPGEERWCDEAHGAH